MVLALSSSIKQVQFPKRRPFPETLSEKGRLVCVRSIPRCNRSNYQQLAAWLFRVFEVAPNTVSPFSGAKKTVDSGNVKTVASSGMAAYDL